MNEDCVYHVGRGVTVTGTITKVSGSSYLVSHMDPAWTFTSEAEALKAAEVLRNKEIERLEMRIHDLRTLKFTVR